MDGEEEKKKGLGLVHNDLSSECRRYETMIRGSNMGAYFGEMVSCKRHGRLEPVHENGQAGFFSRANRSGRRRVTHLSREIERRTKTHQRKACQLCPAMDMEWTLPLWAWPLLLRSSQGSETADATRIYANADKEHRRRRYQIWNRIYRLRHSVVHSRTCF